jgi:DMSO/TMAO reductase YedYZ molybdopterin-dependent catalytic subunit
MNENERNAFVGYISEGFHLKPSPPPHELTEFLTSDASLFETIHMGAPKVDESAWMLVIDGLVRNPLRLSLVDLKALPYKEVTSFHECYGSPLKPATSPVHRVGNVAWAGVSLDVLLNLAGLEKDAQFIWSEGLDRGSYGGQAIDRYQKDLPLEKALSAEVLVAYAMNGMPLSINRGGPVRLVAPGYFGTNSTKWLCKISAQRDRPTSPFTTVWYNETVQESGSTVTRPVWEVTPHSIITSPEDKSTVQSGAVKLNGWAWAGQPVSKVEVSVDDGASWIEADVEPRHQFEWQLFQVLVNLPNGIHRIACRATDINGLTQPLRGSRNEVNRIQVTAK